MKSKIIISVQMTLTCMLASTSSLRGPLDEQLHQQKPVPRVFRPTTSIHRPPDTSHSNFNNSEQSMCTSTPIPHQSSTLVPHQPLPGRHQHTETDSNPRKRKSYLDWNWLCNWLQLDTSPVDNSIETWELPDEGAKQTLWWPQIKANYFEEYNN
jgi:hypothetical protein